MWRWCTWAQLMAIKCAVRYCTGKVREYRPCFLPTRAKRFSSLCTSFVASERDTNFQFASSKTSIIFGWHTFCSSRQSGVSFQENGKHERGKIYRSQTLLCSISFDVRFGGLLGFLRSHRTRSVRVRFFSFASYLLTELRLSLCRFKEKTLVCIQVLSPVAGNGFLERKDDRYRMTFYFQGFSKDKWKRAAGLLT